MVPKISIIVPVYKAEAILERCVDSILGQTFRDFELILVDDGSPDNCPALCDMIAERAPSVVKVIHKENGGAAAARNVALDVIKGKYLTFVDSDDWIEPDMLEHFVDIAEETGCDMVSSEGIVEYTRDRYTVKQAEENLKIVSGIELIQDAYQGKLWAEDVIWGRLYKSSLFQNLRFTEGMIYEDAAIQFPLLACCDKVARSNQRFYHYYHSPDSVMRAKISERIMDSLFVLEQRMNFCIQHEMTDLLEQVKVAYYVQLAHLKYDFATARWQGRQDILHKLNKKADLVRADVKKSPYFTGALKMKCVMFTRFPRLTQFIIQIKKRVDKNRLEKRNRQMIARSDHTAKAERTWCV